MILNQLSKEHEQRSSALLFMLIVLTGLFVLAQIIFFVIHSKLTELLDALVHSSLSEAVFFQANIFFPIAEFILIQCLVYALFIGWIWFTSVSIAEWFKLSPQKMYFFGLFFLLLAWIALFSLNLYYFPNSFFAEYFYSLCRSSAINKLIMLLSVSILILFTLFAYVNFFVHRQYRVMGVLLLIIFFFVFANYLYDQFYLLGYRSLLKKRNAVTSLPNVIFIGLDSLRPDFLSYFFHGSTPHSSILTQHIDAFLKNSVVFSKAYTPLARTYPAWVSVLTAEYPKHHGARNNLANPMHVISNDTLAKHLKQLGYYTIYGTDEKRFSNITKAYGFDRIIGPEMGLNDFIIGGLVDFPMTNLLIKVPSARWLFPYHYANRAAAITYNPDDFLRLVQIGLNDRPNQPLFLAIHLCLAHWPFLWAARYQGSLLSEKYRNSIERVDKQLGQLLSLLKKNQLLDHSVVVLLSDHGTTVGLPGDRIVQAKAYIGDALNMKKLPLFRSEKTHEPTMNIAYGHGCDLLSLKQNHVLLAFRGFGLPMQKANIKSRSMLIDVAPTLLAYLKLPPLLHRDGVSLASYLTGDHTAPVEKKLLLEKREQERLFAQRPLFMETGASIGNVQSANIEVDKLVQSGINAYGINTDGLLFTRKNIEQSIVSNKQRAVLLDQWLLVRYPESFVSKFVPDPKNKNQLMFKTYPTKPYFVLVNVKNGQWSMDFSGPLAKQAPLSLLMYDLKQFFGREAI